MKFNRNLIEDLVFLRNEMESKAFTETGAVKSTTHAEFFYKLNSVLYKGYPHTATENAP